MIKSMTGYGMGEATHHGRTITVEMRSVNNRYLDCNVRMPRMYVFAEEAIKTRVQEYISRGKVDLYISIDNVEGERISISLNEPVLNGYYEALCQMRDSYHLKDDISVSLMSRLPDAFVVEKAKDDLKGVAEDIVAVVDLALADFDKMRQTEGAKLAEDIKKRSQLIADLTSIVEERSPKTVEEYRNKLINRMNEVLENTQIDESRILTEAAIFADKIAVTEETVRLRSHLSQLNVMLEQGGTIGRKLDFLIQEFNREANTIGSKCNDLTLAHHVVDLKGEIEKIREQVQNIE